MKEFQTLLANQLADRKQRNPQFSLRAFAKFLEMSPAQLSSLINGKKKLTPKQATKIIQHLNLDERTADLVLRDLLPPGPQVRFKLPDLRFLAEDEFKMIADWEHFAILSLGQLKDNQANSKWIAQKLGIDPIMALQAFQRLERMGLIEIADGQFKQTSKPLTTTTDIPSTAIRKYHKQNLQMAIDKLEQVPIEEREFSAITMAVSPDKMAIAKKMISEFKQKLCQELEGPDSREVYTLSIQLFPLTK